MECMYKTNLTIHLHKPRASLPVSQSQEIKQTARRNKNLLIAEPDGNKADGGRTGHLRSLGGEEIRYHVHLPQKQVRAKFGSPENAPRDRELRIGGGHAQQSVGVRGHAVVQSTEET